MCRMKKQINKYTIYIFFAHIYMNAQVLLHVAKQGCWVVQLKFTCRRLTHLISFVNMVSIRMSYWDTQESDVAAALQFANTFCSRAVCQHFCWKWLALIPCNSLELPSLPSLRSQHPEFMGGAQGRIEHLLRFRSQNGPKNHRLVVFQHSTWGHP